MENESQEITQAKEAVNKAFSEKIITEDSTDVGRVIDSDYAKHLANVEDKIRSKDPSSEAFKQYAQNAANEEIVNNMTEIASRKVIRDTQREYPDANKMAIETGFNPVSKNMARRELDKIGDMQEAERKRREYREKQNS